MQQSKVLEAKDKEFVVILTVFIFSIILMNVQMATYVIEVNNLIQSQINMLLILIGMTNRVYGLSNIKTYWINIVLIWIAGFVIFGTYVYCN